MTKAAEPHYDFLIPGCFCDGCMRHRKAGEAEKAIKEFCGILDRSKETTRRILSFFTKEELLREVGIRDEIDSIRREIEKQQARIDELERL